MAFAASIKVMGVVSGEGVRKCIKTDSFEIFFDKSIRMKERSFSPFGSASVKMNTVENYCKWRTSARIQLFSNHREFRMKTAFQECLRPVTTRDDF